MKPRENCIICNERIHRSKCKTKYSENRKPADLTCSHRCSRIYSRVSEHVRGNLNEN